MQRYAQLSYARRESPRMLKSLLLLLVSGLFITSCHTVNAGDNMPYYPDMVMRAETVDDLIVDPTGNIFVFGNFQDSVDFDPGQESCLRKPDLYSSTYISRFDPSGNFHQVYVWDKDFPQHIYPGGIALDPKENIIIVGEFEGTADLNPSEKVNLSTVHTYGPQDLNDTDAFIERIGANDKFELLKTIGGDDSDTAYDVAVDGDGNVYICGGFRGFVDFTPDWHKDRRIATGKTPADQEMMDAFLAKYDSAGNYLWCNTWGGIVEDFAYQMAIDPDGNVLVLGAWSGEADFDTGAAVDKRVAEGSHTTMGVDMSLSKFAPDGNFLWAGTWSGFKNFLGSMNYTDGVCRCSGNLAFDKNANIYLEGAFHGTVDLNPSSEIDLHTTSAMKGFSGGDLFLCKLDRDGNYMFGKSWPGVRRSNGRGLSVGKNGEVLLACSFSDTVDLDPGPKSEERTSSGVKDLAVIRLDSKGRYRSALSWNNPGESDDRFITLNHEGVIFVAGFFKGTVDFDPGDGVDNHTASGDYDLFLSRYDKNGLWKWSKTWGSAQNEYSYGGP
jgi:hypothetical protein